MTSPLSPEAVAQMVADREAGTPGPWVSIHLGTKKDFAANRDFHFIRGAHQCGDDTALATVNNGENGHAVSTANARRIARLPALEAAYLTLSAENATLRAELDAMTERATDAELNWTNCTRLAQRLRASEAAALDALAEIGVVVAALEGKDSLDREMIRNIGTRIAALTPTADKEPKT